MIARDLINAELTPLKTSDSGLDAINLMDDFKVSHLPVVNHNEFLGLIAETDILESCNPEASIGSMKLSLNRSFVSDDQHLFDLIKIMDEQKLSLLPVLDSKNKFIGSLTRACLVSGIARMTSIENPGGIIVLGMSVSDYSLAQIAQIVESNEARILSSYITSHADSTKMEVTLKINKIDLRAILQTFNRYEYELVASYSESQIDDTLQDRYDSLMRYLDL